MRNSNRKRKLRLKRMKRLNRRKLKLINKNNKNESTRMLSGTKARWKKKRRKLKRPTKK
jgi:hypothetical protein